MDECLHFYRDLLGFKLSDVLAFKKIPGMGEKLYHVEDGRGYFFYYGHDHHAFVLFPRAVRSLTQRGILVAVCGGTLFAGIRGFVNCPDRTTHAGGVVGPR